MNIKIVRLYIIFSHFNVLPWEGSNNANDLDIVAMLVVSNISVRKVNDIPKNVISEEIKEEEGYEVFFIAKGVDLLVVYNATPDGVDSVVQLIITILVAYLNVRCSAPQHCLSLN